MYGYEEFEYVLDGLDDEFFLIVAGGILLVALFVTVLSIVSYIFQSLGLYTLAKNRGIKNPWLAWLPVGYYWIAGSLADQYRYVVKGEDRNRRMIVLVLALAGMVLSGVTSAVSGGVMLESMSHISVDNMEGMMDAAMEGGMVNGLLGMVSNGVGIALFVFWQICLYDLYNSCDPDKAVLFLVLGIIFGFLVPFFIFACRKKERGMPPRRTEPEVEPRIYREPWEDI